MVRLFAAFLLISSSLLAQELVQNDYERGYTKDGIKVSVWQYFNSKKQPELVINHSNGRVMFISKDSSLYFIFKDGKWINTKLDVHPVPIEGSQNFFRDIFMQINYPVKDYMAGLEGKIEVIFEVDTLGLSRNFEIVKGIGGTCDSAVISGVKSVDQKWIPAKLGKKKYASRLGVAVEFRLKRNEAALDIDNFEIKDAKILNTIIISSPDVIKNTNESGVLYKDQKVGIWDYNYRSGKELSVDYSNNKILFLEADTTKYIINYNGSWRALKTDKRPIPMEGTYNFINLLQKSFVYPDNEFKKKNEGKVCVMFDVDTLGLMKSYSICKSQNPSLDSAVIAGLNKVNQRWYPAEINNKKYSARFALTIEFRLNSSVLTNNSNRFEQGILAKPLPEEIVVEHYSMKIFTFVEKSAEPIGGMAELFKWINKNKIYPSSARRMGLEGKSFVKFIIEQDGSITNVSVYRGFDGACDREAFRVISAMPKWKPGTQGGRPVRQAYTLPVVFKLDE